MQHCYGVKAVLAVGVMACLLWWVFELTHEPRYMVSAILTYAWNAFAVFVRYAEPWISWSASVGL